MKIYRVSQEECARLREGVPYVNPLEHSVVSDATGLAIRFNMQLSARRLRHRRLLVILALSVDGMTCLILFERRRNTLSTGVSYV